NAIVREFSVAREHAGRCARVFQENAELVGLVREASTGLWLVPQPIDVEHSVAVGPEDGVEQLASDDSGERRLARLTSNGGGRDLPSIPQSGAEKPLRVFISHSKNMEIVGQIKTMLNAVEIPFEIAVEQETTAIPVPDKVFSAMRNCSAAI